MNDIAADVLAILRAVALNDLDTFTYLMEVLNENEQSDLILFFATYMHELLDSEQWEALIARLTEEICRNA